MDFLILISVYAAFCCIFFGCYMTNWIIFNYYPFSAVLFILQKIIAAVGDSLPNSVSSFLSGICDVILFHRSIIFQCVYILIVIVCHGIGITDALPYMYRVQPDINHTFWMVICFVFNVGCFLVCSFSDPGVITKENISLYKSKYNYDEILYSSGGKCDTCNLEKIARSKHCSITNKCIYKFDHYCLFTNSCIGGLNHRYFILFLLSICAMTCNGITMGVKALRSVTEVHQLWKARFIDEFGDAREMNIRVLSQTLFMRHPRLVFTSIALPIILAAIGIFTIYHLYLVVTNQTTNERYKLDRIKQCINRREVINSNPFNKGVLINVLDIILPQSDFYRQRKDIPAQNGVIRGKSKGKPENLKRKKTK